MDQQLESYRQAVIAIAIAAGDKILAIYAKDFTAQEKDDHSPLTEADLAAHNVITNALKKLTPEIPILSEESAKIAFQERARWTRFWLVDPLDGTKEFIKRNGEFTVNIALMDNGKPILGIVHVPVTKTTYSAVYGAGAWKQVADGAPEAIRARTYKGGKATIVASRSHAGAPLAEFLTRLSAQEGPPDTVSMGSALKLCLVAEGRADLYPRLGLTSEWDTAAAHCVVEAAGGWVKGLAMDNLSYNKPSLLNPWFLVGGPGGYDWTGPLAGIKQDN